MNLGASDFELFGLSPRFAQDRAAIDTRWKALQREAHPDRFAAEGAAAQRLAMQWSVRINEAYQRLKNPLLRAAYLCELNGAPVQAESNTAMPTEFLMRQMQWREELEEAHSAEDIERIAQVLKQENHMMLLECERLMDAERNFSAAADQVRALMFIDKFGQDLNQRLDQLEA
jgi:molecular chaperone HscB